VKDFLVIAALVGLALVAILNQSWPWLAAVTGIGISFFGSRNARLATRIQLIFVGALGGGLGAEIVRTIYLAGQSTDSGGVGGMYKQVLIVSLGTVVFVLGAMLVEHLLRKLFSRQEI
jgi:hypothetical protein